jgi:hypothetical protein
MAPKKRRYTGELATPIKWPDPPTFEGAVTEKRAKERHQQKAEAQVQRKLAKKMSSLMSEYGLTGKKDFTELAWKLAFEHVPGFKLVLPAYKELGIVEGYVPKPKRGRKLRWDPLRLEMLLAAVETVKRDCGLNTDRQALKFIANNPDYKKVWGLPMNHRGTSKQWIETLESRLQEAKRQRASLLSLSEEFETIRSRQLRMKFRKS